MAKILVHEPATSSIKQLLTRGQQIWFGLLVATLVFCGVFLRLTRDAVGNLSFLKPGSLAQQAAQPKALVDVSPWLTAQALTPLAVSREEKQDAHEAERLADHDVDQAFASALRKAELQKPTLSPEAKELNDRVSQFQELVKEDQAKVASLSPAVPASNGVTAKSTNAAPDSDDVVVAKAQLGLDVDELSDAQKDLARAVGDDRGRIQQELSAHEAVMQKYDSQTSDPGELAVTSSQRNGSLTSRISAWFDQRTRHTLLLQAAQDSRTLAASLTATHNSVEAAANRASTTSGSSTDETAPADNPPSAATRLSIIKAKASQRQMLSIYDDRIQTEQQLAIVYDKWAAQVWLQHRIVLHLIVQSIGVIGFILFFQFFVDMAIRYWTGRPRLDPRQQHTLRTILQVVLQIVSLLLVLVVLFGKPQQISTILGLATAGLTVALQSYILGFCGWFILVGKNGIRVGDTVEINGVTGQVSEIGLFRTMMLETGNWTAKGHPTGRLVAFMNTFAVTGQYFNFSTTGQWMWDELAVSIPAADDIYGMIEAIHSSVLKETEEDAASAESEWKQVSRGSALSQFSAAPTINLRPAASGVDIVVRYVTRASDRFETKNHLYQAVIDVFHKPQPQTAIEEKA